ncbi:MAG: hypothetical protein N2254_09860 [bacterium]|nr:hypothetical protein [bacterium]
MEKAEVEGSIVKEVIADTGYDTHEIFRYLGGKGIKAVITGNRAKRNRERLMFMVGFGMWMKSFSYLSVGLESM